MVVLVAVLCLWAIFAVALNFLGIDIYWPFYVASEEPIPHHRLLVARNGVFLTFAFYGLMFLRNSRKGLSDSFLKDVPTNDSDRGFAGIYQTGNLCT